MDPAMRDHVRHAPRITKPAAHGRVAPRRTKQLRDAARRQGGQNRRRATRESGGVALSISPDAADPVLFGPVPVLLEQLGCADGVSHMVQHDSEPDLIAATGAVSVWRRQHIARTALSAGHFRPGSVSANRISYFSPSWLFTN